MGRCDQWASLHLCVVCGPGEGHSFSGCEVLWMTLSASNKYRERMVGGERWKIQGAANDSRIEQVNTSLPHEITLSSKVFFSESKEQKIFRIQPKLKFTGSRASLCVEQNEGKMHPIDLYFFTWAKNVVLSQVLSLPFHNVHRRKNRNKIITT